MEPSTWADIKEIVLYLLNLIGPFAVFLAGKFILNKWEKKQKILELKRLETQTEIDETIKKEKEADILLVYDGLARRAAEDVITKSDRLRVLEGEWNSKFDKMEKQIGGLNQEVGQLRGENAGLKNQILLLNQKNQALETENTDLKERVRILENDINERNCLDKEKKE